MAKYKLELKPIRIHGMAKLNEQDQQVFQIALNSLIQFLQLVEGVSGVSLQSDHSILIEGSEDLTTTLSQLHKEAYLTRIE